MPKRNKARIKESRLPDEVLNPKPLPDGGRRLAKALKTLLKEKDFNSITTAEIARTAKANEALIYRYFKDKRGLLHHVLADYMRFFIVQLENGLKDIVDPVEKLRYLIHGTLYFYNDDIVFSKILLIEVRNFPRYFESETFRIVRHFTRLVGASIIEGMEKGVFRDDQPPSRVRDMVLGSIEHQFLPKIIFGKEIDIDEIAEGLCGILFKGISSE